MPGTVCKQAEPLPVMNQPSGPLLRIFDPSCQDDQRQADAGPVSEPLVATPALLAELAGSQ